MFIYYILLILLGILGIFYKNRSDRKNGKKSFLWFSCILLILFTGLRGLSVGTDTASYARIYNSLFKVDDYKLWMEIGYRYFVVFCHFFTDDVTVFMTICAAIAIGTLGYSIGKYSNDVVTSIICYLTLGYLFINFNVSRQGIAIALTVLAFFYILDRKWIRSGLLILSAICFHTSAIICFLYYFSIYAIGGNVIEDKKFHFLEKRQRWWISATVIVVGGVAIFFDEILELIMQILPYRYEHYFQAGGSFNRTGYIFVVFINVAIWLFLIFCTSKNSEAKKKYLVPSTLAVLFSILQMNIYLFARFIWYFDIFNIFIIPAVLEDNLFQSESKKIVRFIVLGLCVLLFTYYLIHNYQGSVPYRFIFQE